jgi:hypothetical protein
MINNKERIGNFTSSQIFRLMSKGRGSFSLENTGAAYHSYIEEKRLETRMGRSLGTEVHTQAMAWGKFMEMYVFSLIGIEYKITSLTTDVHPTIKRWAGSKDLIVPGVKVSDIKCYQPKKFGEYTDALLRGDVVELREKFPQEYWQLVSNAIINGVDKGEAITFMPYERELEEIREMAENYDGSDQWKYRFIAEGDKSSLPYLPNDGYYKHLNEFEFLIPQEDIDNLTARVEMAIVELEKQL